MFMWFSMLVEGSELDIELHKKHSRRQKILTGSEEGPMPKANIKFDDLQNTCLLGQERTVGGSLL